MPNESINPDNHFRASFYSQGVKAGGAVYVAGQVGVQDGQVAGGGDDLAAEARQALENVRKVVEAAGGVMADVVSLTCFLTDINQGRVLHPIIEGLFPGTKPAVTSIVVKSIGALRYKMEIQGVAIIQG